MKYNKSLFEKIDLYLRDQAAVGHRSLDEEALTDANLQQEILFHKSVNNLIIDAHCLYAGELAAKVLQKQKLIRTRNYILLGVGSIVLVALGWYFSTQKNENQPVKRLVTLDTTKEINSADLTKDKSSERFQPILTQRAQNLIRISAETEPQNLTNNLVRDTLISKRDYSDQKVANIDTARPWKPIISKAHDIVTTNVPQVSITSEQPKEQDQQIPKQSKVLFQVAYNMNRDVDIELPLDNTESGSYKIIDSNGKVLDHVYWQAGEKIIWNGQAKIYLFESNKVYSVLVSNKNDNVIGIGYLHVIQ